ncbi:hypothetical protein VNO80_06925 [Phaseolus coccineus]|uniref:Uncharacterized protein n=1 Tax=Phaseolus coccineus TaxID=3886 RepID=A0AAN9NMM6_PHACN
MDPALGNFMSNLKHQAAARKIGKLVKAGKEKIVVAVEAALTTLAIPPAANRSRGRPPKVQTGAEAGQSTARQLSMLSPSIVLK